MRIVVWIAVLSCLACAAPEPQLPTPYQPLDLHGGYTNEPIGDGKWIVTFRGNPLTLPEHVQAMAYRRAGELCPNGYDTLSERDMSVTETEDDRTRCAVIYGSVYCRHHQGQSMTRPRWQLTIACK